MHTTFRDVCPCGLQNVRIPRRHLLAKRQHVEPDGTYVKHGKGGGNDKAHYLTMMQARAGMCGIAGAWSSPPVSQRELVVLDISFCMLPR